MFSNIAIPVKKKKERMPRQYPTLTRANSRLVLQDRIPAAKAVVGFIGIALIIPPQSL